MITTPFLTASTALPLPRQRLGPPRFHTLTLTHTRTHLAFGPDPRKRFASISASASRSSSNKETTSIGVNPQLSVPPPPPPSYIGSPLFWIGVGVGLSALFSWVATNLKIECDTARESWSLVSGLWTVRGLVGDG